ncbi:hypothetical protein J5Y03_08075 [Bacillus sp. RG28]|uniref:Uncharacterized protein n=1 Tax=Gottfriedia endophytica TaxID=2820819 RepID=A0A940SJQ4_9BACI|nr:hypothetical protein [Gottfriedia endophytica]MBP0725149.1 hypothetical protein [Gottfriedia endophytica]
MEERIVEVNGFVGPSYKDGFFGFRYNQQLVPNYIGDHYGSVYHLNMSMIESLATDFPAYVLAFDPKIDKISEWGPQTEVGLCKLMMDGKMQLIRKNEIGEEILIRFIWDGPIWIPKNRPTKRK